MQRTTPSASVQITNLRAWTKMIPASTNLGIWVPGIPWIELHQKAESLTASNLTPFPSFPERSPMHHVLNVLQVSGYVTNRSVNRALGYVVERFLPATACWPLDWMQVPKRLWRSWSHGGRILVLKIINKQQQHQNKKIYIT